MKKILKSFAYVFIVLLSIVALGAIGSWLEDVFTDKKIKGIDLSHHNNFSVTELRILNPKFCYIKASEGGDWRDEDRWKNFRKVSKITENIGFYHFFIDYTPAETQLANFKAAISRKYQPLSSYMRLVPAIDYEAPFTAEPEVRIERLKELVMLFKKEFGDVIIYCGPSEYSTLKAIFPDTRFWMPVRKSGHIYQWIIRFNGKEIDMNRCAEIPLLKTP